MAVVARNVHPGIGLASLLLHSSEMRDQAKKNLQMAIESQKIAPQKYGPLHPFVSHERGIGLASLLLRSEGQKEQAHQKFASIVEELTRSRTQLSFSDGTSLSLRPKKRTTLRGKRKGTIKKTSNETQNVPPLVKRFDFTSPSTDKQPELVLNSNLVTPSPSTLQTITTTLSTTRQAADVIQLAPSSSNQTQKKQIHKNKSALRKRGFSLPSRAEERKRQKEQLKDEIKNKIERQRLENKAKTPTTTSKPPTPETTGAKPNAGEPLIDATQQGPPPSTTVKSARNYLPYLLKGLGISEQHIDPQVVEEITSQAMDEASNPNLRVKQLKQLVRFELFKK